MRFRPALALRCAVAAVLALLCLALYLIYTAVNMPRDDSVPAGLTGVLFVITEYGVHIYDRRNIRTHDHGTTCNNSLECNKKLNKPVLIAIGVQTMIISEVFNYCDD